MKKPLSILVLFALFFAHINAFAKGNSSKSITTGTTTASIAAGSSPGNASVKNATGKAAINNFPLIAKPTISGFTLNSGGSVKITGTNLNGATAVTFGGVPAANFFANKSTSIIAIVGDGASGNIQVVTPGGTATIGGFTYLPKPTITSFTPSSGGNNTVVDVFGTNFTNVTDAFIAQNEASFYVVSPTNVRIIVGSIDPENTIRSGEVAVSTLGGMAISETDFTYIPPPEITSFSPSTAGQGDTVTITGNNFTGLNFVGFGNIPATSFTLVSPTTIKAVVGSGETGKIHVVTSGGGSTFSATNFTHTTPASITSFSPKTGRDGDVITITGVNLSSVNSVRIGGVESQFKIQSPTTILATVYYGASGKISANPGSGFIYSADDFTYISPITIKSFSPTTGVPGDKVTIIGTDFGRVAGVKFGGVPAASYTNSSLGYEHTSIPDTIVATLGQGATGKITLNTSGNVVTITSATDFTFLQAPAITSFAPATAAQGDTITITGNNFTGATKVMFGTAPAAYFAVTSPTSILAKVVSDTGVGGKISISVTTPYGTTSSATKLTIIPPPTVQSFTPSSGGRNTQISITGNHLNGTNHVYIGGVEIRIIQVTATSIVAGGNIANSGNITFTASGGTGNAGYFTYLNQPSITSFSPAQAALGDTITITGTNFTGVTNVTFGGVPAASFAVVSPTSIFAKVGSGASGKITIISPDGKATSATDLTFLLTPLITSFTPAAAGQGVTVTITGSNFKNLTGVSFGGVPSTSFKALSATSITAIVPNTATSGNIEVTTTVGKATTGGFTFLPKPVITSFSPARAASGDTVIITGTNFNDVTAVRFNNVVPAQSFTVVSSTSIIAIVGAGASGNVNVVTTGGATSKTGFVYIQPPTITSFSPAQAAQGGIITITGTNFADVTAVSIGGIAPASFTRLSPTSISTKVIPGVSGKITVTSPAGTATSATDFIFLPPPAITSFTPAKAAQGDVVTITGSNFTGVTAVKFGNLAALSFTVVSPTTITAVVGAGAKGNVTVVTTGGTANIPGFVFILPPVIRRFPAQAPENYYIPIFGNNFTGATSVSIGGVPASYFGIQSDTVIVAKVNAQVHGKIIVTSPGGTATSATDFTTLPPNLPPINVTSFTPTQGQQGDVVTLTGGDFTGVTSVYFNGVLATSFTIVSPTTITATVGTGRTGRVIVNKPGASGVSSTDFIFVPPPAVITSFTPAKAAQGDTVIISGSNFTTVTSVTFGGVPAETFTAYSPNAIAAKVGAGASGTISVTTPRNTVTSNDTFTFLPTPKHKSFDMAATGVKENQTNILSKIISYPNPFTNSITLKLGEKVFKNLKVDVLNYFGKVLYSKEFVGQAGDVTLDLSNLEASQVYVLKLSAGNTEYVTKIAKK